MSASRPVSFEEFRRVVAQMPGCEAWRSKAGSGTGSIFTLQFGPPLFDNDQEGKFSLMVYCAWRIVEAGRILCTWHEDAETVLAPTLRQLWSGQRSEVHEAVLSPLGDLTSNFTNGRGLQIWNDAPFEENSECWSVGYQGRGYYAISARNQFTYEENK